MKLQQLRYIVEVARRGLNVSDAADALFTSQPGVSKQIRLLEDELGVIIFKRSGKRFSGVTEPGHAILAAAEDILKQAENLKKIGHEYAKGDSGSLVIATTHTQACYVLPNVIHSFKSLYPDVRLSLHQGNPTQIANWICSGEADLGIATEALMDYSQLVTLPVQQWAHSVIVPKGHALEKLPALTLNALARWPLVMYSPEFAGGRRIKQAFERQELEPDVVLTALDADVIKTYVKSGLGLGIVASMAINPELDVELTALDAGHLFESNTTRVAVRRNNYLRRFEYDLINLLAPHLTRKLVDQAFSGEGEAYEL